MAVVVVAGCASAPSEIIPAPQQSPQPGTSQFSVTIAHTAYSPSTFEVAAGDTVRFIALAAKGTGAESGFSHNHGITIDEYEINAAVPSETTPTMITFVADKAGTFSVYCRTCWDGPFGREHPDIRATLVVK